MGSGSDAELAKFLAEEAEKKAGRADACDAAPPSEWRWRSTGWGEWGAKPPASAPSLNAASKSVPDEDEKG
jgi:hypothetical protein